MTKKCATCQFWSEMIAMVRDGTTVAMCLSNGKKSSQYMPKWGGCDDHQAGLPVDLDHVPAGQLQRSLDYHERLQDDDEPAF